MLAASACAVSREHAATPCPAGSGAGHGTVSLAPHVSANSLWGVAALDESDAWAVGGRYFPSGRFRALIEHWDGQSWKVVPNPAGIGGQITSNLDAVAIDAPDDAWAVGRWSPATHVPREYGLIEHWNGAHWTVVPGPSPCGRTSELTAVAAISPNAAWAIGFGYTGARPVTVFMGWDGTRWRYLPSPGGGFGGGLTAISARDIWLVGGAGATKSPPTAHTLIQHWNGSKWTIVPAPYEFKHRKLGLGAVGGSSRTNVWAAGSYQSGPDSSDLSPLVEHWDGTRWRLQPSPNPTGSRGETGLDSIAAPSRTSALAVGSAWGSHGSIPLLERWDGVHWTTVPSRLRPGVTDPTLIAVAAVDPCYAWAVGEATLRPNILDKHITLIEKWNCASLQQVPSPNP